MLCIYTTIIDKKRCSQWLGLTWEPVICLSVEVCKRGWTLSGCWGRRTKPREQSAGHPGLWVRTETCGPTRFEPSLYAGLSLGLHTLSLCPGAIRQGQDYPHWTDGMQHQRASVIADCQDPLPWRPSCLVSGHFQVTGQGHFPSQAARYLWLTYVGPLRPGRLALCNSEHHWHSTSGVFSPYWACLAARIFFAYGYFLPVHPQALIREPPP